MAVIEQDAIRVNSMPAIMPVLGISEAAATRLQSMMRENLEIYDRVGGGDGFASGLAYGFLEGKGPQAAVEYGAAHGALAMTTPGDTSMVNVAEVEAVMKGKGARVIR